MDFKKSKTIKNLATAFAGESQASARYKFLASRAKKEKLTVVQAIITEISNQETRHAKIFYQLIEKYSGNGSNNVNVDAGYPYKTGTFVEELFYAVENEKEEYEHDYPAFAKIAREEGFEDVAEKFEQIAEIENVHANLLNEIASKIKNGTLYKEPKAVKWKCLECGHEEYATEPWEICPVCDHDRGHVKLQIVW